MEQKPVASSGSGEYALFLGDAAAHLWDSTLPAVLRLLKAIHIEPVIIGSGRNSGFLASSLGLSEIAESLADKNLTELKKSGAKKLLTLCPGDYFAFETIYSDRLGASLPEEIELIDLVSLLASEHEAGNLQLNRIEIGLPYAYVDPTHAIRTLDRIEAPRHLLNAVLPSPVIELFWRKERAHPAGDGILQFTQPALFYEAYAST